MGKCPTNRTNVKYKTELLYKNINFITGTQILHESLNSMPSGTNFFFLYKININDTLAARNLKSISLWSCIVHTQHWMQQREHPTKWIRQKEWNYLNISIISGHPRLHKTTQNPNLIKIMLSPMGKRQIFFFRQVKTKKNVFLILTQQIAPTWK